MLFRMAYSTVVCVVVLFVSLVTGYPNGYGVAPQPSKSSYAPGGGGSLSSAQSISLAGHDPYDDGDDIDIGPVVPVSRPISFGGGGSPGGYGNGPALAVQPNFGGGGPAGFPGPHGGNPGFGGPGGFGGNPGFNPQGGAGYGPGAGRPGKNRPKNKGQFIGQQPENFSFSNSNSGSGGFPANHGFQPGFNGNFGGNPGVNYNPGFGSSPDYGSPLGGPNYGGPKIQPVPVIVKQPAPVILKPAKIGY